MDGTLPSSPLRELFPGLSEEELQEAEFNLRRYLSLVMEIVERQERELVDNSFDEPSRKTVASKLSTSVENPSSSHP
ncbi:MAG: hypothetical protein HUU16_14735 [Candidatus Omnitrophica bacterium]|nr:hypothetical protein [bacterium]NUN97416.1 hypothetical protein [Candidatus Omnitrophota bacterium]